MPVELEYPEELEKEHLRDPLCFLRSADAAMAASATCTVSATIVAADCASNTVLFMRCFGLDCVSMIVVIDWEYKSSLAWDSNEGDWIQSAGKMCVRDVWFLDIAHRKLQNVQTRQRESGWLE